MGIIICYSALLYIYECLYTTYICVRAFVYLRDHESSVEQLKKTIILLGRFFFCSSFLYL